MLPINPLMPGGNRKVTNLQLSACDLFINHQALKG